MVACLFFGTLLLDCLVRSFAFHELIDGAVEFLHREGRQCVCRGWLRLSLWPCVFVVDVQSSSWNSAKSAMPCQKKIVKPESTQEPRHDLNHDSLKTHKLTSEKHWGYVTITERTQQQELCKTKRDASGRGRQTAEESAHRKYSSTKGGTNKSNQCSTSGQEFSLLPTHGMWRRTRATKSILRATKKHTDRCTKTNTRLLVRENINARRKTNNKQDGNASEFIE